MLGKLLGPDIQDMLDAKRLAELRQALVDIPPYDIAELIEDLPESQQAIVFRILPRTLATDVFEKMDVDVQHVLVSSLNQEQLRHIIEEMDPDDRTALLEELPARVTRKLLRLLSEEERKVAQSLLAYPEYSIGRLMTPDYIELRAGWTVSEALDFIRQVGMDKETVYVCYVTQPGHVLEGVLGLRRLVVSDPQKLIEDLMDEPSAVVYTHQDQEVASRAMQDYDLLALPVLDTDHRLVGIVTVDDVLDVVEEEASEDIQVMAGVLPETEHSYLNQRILGISWRRGAPLFGLLVGQFVAANVMRNFHAELQAVIALSFFIPMIMATGGATGIQTATLIVRSFSTGEMVVKDFFRVLWREIAICLLLAVVLGSLALGIGNMMLNSLTEKRDPAHSKIVTVIERADLEPGAIAVGSFDQLPTNVQIQEGKQTQIVLNVQATDAPAFKIGLTIGFSLLVIMLISAVTGVILPMFFQVMKLDPAVMTSPFLTTVVDVLGILIYFLVARQILHL